PSRPPAVRQWYRFRPVPRFADPFLEAARALVLIDTLIWPAACQRHIDPSFAAPNLDVVAWFHRLAHGSEWLLADATAPLAEGAAEREVRRHERLTRRQHADERNRVGHDRLVVDEETGDGPRGQEDHDAAGGHEADRQANRLASAPLGLLRTPRAEALADHG